jgi:hypothetical protein
MARARVRVARGREMNWLYLTAGVTAALVLAYLAVALLKPEKFS